MGISGSKKSDRASQYEKKGEELTSDKKKDKNASKDELQSNELKKRKDYFEGRI